MSQWCDTARDVLPIIAWGRKLLLLVQNLDPKLASLYTFKGYNRPRYATSEFTRSRVRPSTSGAGVVSYDLSVPPSHHRERVYHSPHLCRIGRDKHRRSASLGEIVGQVHHGLMWPIPFRRRNPHVHGYRQTINEREKKEQQKRKSQKLDGGDQQMRNMLTPSNVFKTADFCRGRRDFF